MIIIHSPDIMLARTPLQVIHKTWWQQFGYDNSSADVSGAQYDLELADRSELTTQQISDLRNLTGVPSLVATSSLDTIPTDVLDQVKTQNRLVGLVGTAEERAREMFIYWYKTDSNFRYARTNTSISFYQNMFQQLGIYVHENISTSQYSLIFNYSDLPTLSAYTPLLQLVAADRSLSVPNDDITGWFNPLVTPATPTGISDIITNQATELANFIDVWNEIKNSNSYPNTDYTQVLSSEGRAKFESVIDFLNNLHS